MHSRLQILPLIIVAVLALLEWYAFNGISFLIEQKGGAIGTIGLSIFWGGIVLSFVALFAVSLGGNKFPKALRNFFFAFIFINLTFLLFFDVFMLIDDIRRGTSSLLGYQSIRSVTLLTVGLFVALFPALLFITGMIVGPYNYKVLRHKIVIPNLPKAFEGFRVAQISDIHSGSFYNKRAVNRGIQMILDEKTDAIFFTGDLVNDDAREIEPYMDIFSRLKAPFGVYSILGNHDYGDYVKWDSADIKTKNLDRLKANHGKMGWRLLLNEHTYLEKDGEKIGLIGVENWGKGFHQVGDLEKAAEGCEAPVYILLSHDPTHWEEQVRNEPYQYIDLTLSGHTHGAQMGIEWGKFRWSPIQLRYKRWAGLYSDGAQQLYINRGFGFLGYPGRLGIWPEITVLELTSG